jgi:ABC-2 type transport system permease protein
VSSLYRLMLATQLTRGRMAALAAVGLIGVLIGFAIGNSDPIDPDQAAFSFVDGYGLGLLVPATALVFAAAALGDPAEDATLVYLWLRPVARWRIVVASFAASVSVAIPFAVVPTVVAAGLTRTGRDLPVAALCASAVAVTAYSAMFLGLGLLVRRALVWGLAYVLIWEGFVARSGTAAARMSILVYARSLMADLADREPPRLAASVPVAIGVPLAVGVVALALTTWAMRRIDVK